MPRIFFARAPVLLAGESELSNFLQACDLGCLREFVPVLESDVTDFDLDALLPSTLWQQGEVTDWIFREDLLEINVKPRSPSILVVYDKGWTALVDGRPREIFQAYGAFWGILIFEGDRKVRFEYDPKFHLGQTRFPK